MKILITSLVLTASATLSWWHQSDAGGKVIDAAVKRSFEASVAAGLELSINQIQLLNVSGQQLKDINSLSRLTNLEDLQLSNNEIEDLTVLRSLTELVVLDLSNNEIIDLTPLENLEKLQYLNLSQNKIKSIEPLSNLHGLKGLILTENEGLDLSPIKKMTNLKSLFLSAGLQLTPKELTNLRRSLPGCSIILIPLAP